MLWKQRTNMKFKTLKNKELNTKKPLWTSRISLQSLNTIMRSSRFFSRKPNTKFSIWTQKRISINLKTTKRELTTLTHKSMTLKSELSNLMRNFPEWTLNGRTDSWEQLETQKRPSERMKTKNMPEKLLNSPKNLKKKVEKLILWKPEETNLKGKSKTSRLMLKTAKSTRREKN